MKDFSVYVFKNIASYKIRYFLQNKAKSRNQIAVDYAW